MCDLGESSNSSSPNDADLGSTLSQNMASTSSNIVSEKKTAPTTQPKSCMDIDGFVVENSESEDNDLEYLLNCKIHLVGFDASEMRRLVNMIQRGGGSHYISFDEQLTHIVVGTPSESEKKEVRSVSAMGVVNVVKTIWLEDCEREKKQLPVLGRHAAYDLLLPPKGPKLPLPNDQSQRSSVFRGRSICISSTIPDDNRRELVRWILEGGGKLMTEKNVNFEYSVEAHGVDCSRTQSNGVTKVSTQWIRFCLEDGRLVDVSSHIIFSPLQCEVPLPGFIGLKFFVSQYEKRYRDLLRNLCCTLGGEMVKEWTKKVNYLICKVPEGPEYKAARNLGWVHIVTSDWILESVKQKKVVDPARFFPKSSEGEDGICPESQYGQIKTL